MVGNNNSVWSRVRAAAPNCVLYKCVCHSLALCIQHACSALPSNIGYMLAEIPSWFTNSNLRREAFIALFATMNGETASEDARKAPLPFEKLAATRWLVRGKVMFNILVNWYELQALIQGMSRRAKTSRHQIQGENAVRDAVGPQELLLLSFYHTNCERIRSVECKVSTKRC